MDWGASDLDPSLTPPGAKRDRAINGVSLAPLGAGSGMIGLPGDFTPNSRLVRAVAFAHRIGPVADAVVAIDAHQTLFENFDIPKGLVCNGSAEDNTFSCTQ